jgi:hypothetical protein
MTNNPQPNISISGGTFQDFIAGNKTTTVHGDNIGTQINHAQDIEAAELAKEIDQLLTSLEPTIPNLASPTGQETLKEAAIQTLEQKITLKTRLTKALRAGTLKAIEELCNHPAAKIFVATFQAAFPEKK